MSLRTLALLIALPALAAAQGLAAIKGTVRDSTGRPMPNVDITVMRGTDVVTFVPGSRATAFTVGGVTPGLYSVWFQSSGYRTVTYTWEAKAADTVEVKPVMMTDVRKLDAAVVKAENSRRMKTPAVLKGIVTDDAGRPIDEAIVEIAGAGLGGSTLANGGFLFAPLVPATHFVRIRKLGFVPATVSLSLEPGEERELLVRLAPLATNLKPAVIEAQSGFGPSLHEFDDLEKRMKWKSSSGSSYVLGRAELEKYQGAPLSDLAKELGVNWWENRGRTLPPGVRSLNPSAIGGRVGHYGASTAVEGDACILLNGRIFMKRPLTAFIAREIELLEIYPSKREVTTTVADRMHQDCAIRPDGTHKTWYVIWEKGAR
jgi:hypothetical protein